MLIAKLNARRKKPQAATEMESRLRQSQISKEWHGQQWGTFSLLDFIRNPCLTLEKDQKGATWQLVNASEPLNWLAACQV